MPLKILALASLRAAAFFVLWLLLVDSVGSQELVAGGVCAIIAAALATAVHFLGSAGAGLRPSMLRFIYRPFVLLVSDSARVTWALVDRLLFRRPVHGSFRAVEYAAVADEPEHVARRILTEWGASAAPNRYAIGIDSERQLLLVHELVPAPGPLDPLELG